MKPVIIALALIALTCTAVVATNPQIMRNLAVTPCDHYVLVSAHASHPQKDSFGGVTTKIGYDFTYKPWGTVKHVEVLPNSNNVKQVVFIINRTGLMEYFKLFKDWKPRDIALTVIVNGRSLGFEFAYLYPDGSVKGYKNPNVKWEGDKIIVNTHGWRLEPCNLNIKLAPAVEFYNGIAPVNWLSLPGAYAKLKCASCMVNPTSTRPVTAIPNVHVNYVWVDSVTPWHPEVGQTVTVNYGVSLSGNPSMDFHATVLLAINDKSNIVKRVEVVIPKGHDEYKGSLTFVAKEIDYRVFVGVSAYGKTVWSREHQIIVWSVTTALPTTTGAPAIPPSTTPTTTATTSTPTATQTPTTPPAHTPSITERITQIINSIVSWFKSVFHW